MAYAKTGDVKLYSGEASPNDVRLRDITAATGTIVSTLDEAIWGPSFGTSEISAGGDWASTLSDATISPGWVATEIFTGTLASTLSDATISPGWVATEIFTGTLASTLGAATFDATGLETFTGTWASTLGSVTAGWVAVESIPGTWASTLGDVTAGWVAVEVFTGTWASILQDDYVEVLEDATASFIGNVISLNRQERRDQREYELDIAEIQATAAARRARRAANSSGGLTGV